MFEVMDESLDDVLGVRATGKLTRADYADVLEPQLKSLLRRYRTVNVLFLMDENFECWSLGAAWANTVLVFTHRRDFGKVAMVGGPTWEKWCAEKAASPLMNCELQTFGREQLAQAWLWLRPSL